MAKSKFLIALTILSMILLISGRSSIEKTIDPKTELVHEGSPLASEVHAPISIYGNLELATFISNEGLSGQGTFASPYIIENYTIDASSAQGILIVNTDDYLIIQNCTVYDGYGGYFGISCNNVSNVNAQN
ncbi:MAG: hypothetical protein ACTSVZ_02525, partial [Promethearchaeota archaeon]